MTRALLRRLVTLAMALVLVAPPGCVTRALWDTWPEAPASAAPPAPVPVQLEQAVRTGEGAFHVLARYSDGSSRHLAVRPFAAPAGEPAWPDAIRRQDIVVEVEGPLPEGAPLRVAGGAPVDEDAVEAVDLISLDRDHLRVVNAAGESWTLATFSAAPPRDGASVEDDPARQKVLVAFFTPFTLVLDAAIALLVFGPMLPVVAEDLLNLLDGEDGQDPRSSRGPRAVRSLRAWSEGAPPRASTTTSEREGGA